MAEATSREDCVERHRHYHIDISGRLGGRGSIQRRRIETMVRPVRAGERVLDVGCNSGYIVSFLPKGCVAHGVDVAEALVAEARKRMAGAQVAEAESLPHADGSFDVVVLGEIIEHVHDPVEVLREASRVARRLVVGSTPHPDGKWGTSSVHSHRFHVRCFTMDTLYDTLLEAGLKNPQLTIISRTPGDVGQMIVWCAEKP
jgi:ubiquinone/menaquinone biosynthesis C-methylase UbiE